MTAEARLASHRSSGSLGRRSERRLEFRHGIGYPLDQVTIRVVEARCVGQPVIEFYASRRYGWSNGRSPPSSAAAATRTLPRTVSDIPVNPAAARNTVRPLRYRDLGSAACIS